MATRRLSSDDQSPSRLHVVDEAAQATSPSIAHSPAMLPDNENNAQNSVNFHSSSQDPSDTPRNSDAINSAQLSSSCDLNENESLYELDTFVAPVISCSSQEDDNLHPGQQCSDFENSVKGTDNQDSLDSNDLPFSQELPTDQESCSSSGSENELQDDEMKVDETELQDLCPSRTVLSASEAGPTLCEDLYSRLYYDFDEERYTRGLWEDVENADDEALRAGVTQQELEIRADNQRNGGLERWDYASPFDDISVQIDDVNDKLDSRFLSEANTVLDRITEDIASRASHDSPDSDTDVQVTPLECVRTFVTDCLLEKLTYVASRALHKRKKPLTNRDELLGLIILHVLCASYNESPSTICSERERENFFQMGLSAERYYEVWSTLYGSAERRATYDQPSTGWSRTANRATTIIGEIELETAAINREIVYVQNETIFSLDDALGGLLDQNVIKFIRKFNRSQYSECVIYVFKYCIGNCNRV